MNHDLFKKHPMDTKAPPAAQSFASRDVAQIQTAAPIQISTPTQTTAQVQTSAHFEHVSAKKKSLLEIFQRTDPLIFDIIDGRKFAALYTISAGSFQSGKPPRWASGNASGHLFLLQRKEPPTFQVSILHLDHSAGEKKIEFTDYMTLEWDIDTQEHYVFYRCVNREDMTERTNEPIRGLWFKDDMDRQAFHVVLLKAFEELERVQQHELMHKQYVSALRHQEHLPPAPAQVPISHYHSTNKQPKQRADHLVASPSQTKQTDQVRELYDLYGISQKPPVGEVEKQKPQHAAVASPPGESMQHHAGERIVLRKRQLPRLIGIAVQHLLANAGENEQVMDAIWNEASSEFCM
eukprot:GEMP01030210.1.p1 GENE.GEMP01030210.1~~GEMP01030210.1.p1  ORF type:complete len:350 (+),score=88.84 GEMP01030210.1:191-1240(+)